MSRPFRAPGEPVPKIPPRFPDKPLPNRPPRRRGLLGAVAALAVAPAVVEAVPAASTDAALLALCAEHIRRAAEEKRLLNLYRAAPDDGPECDAALEAWEAAGAASWEVLDQVIITRAFTLEGAAAKGRSVAEYWLAVGGPSRNDEPQERAAFAVLWDLLEIGGGQA